MGTRHGCDGVEQSQDVDYVLKLLPDDGARSFMEQEVGKVQTAAGKNYWQYIPQKLALENPGTLAQAKLLWETPTLWHAHVASIKRHTIEYPTLVEK